MNDFYMPFRPVALATQALVATIFIAGCSLMPIYERPAAPIAPQWPASAGADNPSAQAGATLTWQNFFTDPTLRQLIDTALANNRDLRVAMVNIVQARAQLGIRQADQFPTLNAAVTGSRTPNSNGAINSAYAGGLTVTAYELDFFWPHRQPQGTSAGPVPGHLGGGANRSNQSDQHRGAKLDESAGR